MAPTRFIPTEVAIKILMNYIHHFKDIKLPDYSSQVWKDLARECDGTWSKHCWWVNIKEDRGKILSEARGKLNIIIDTPQPPTTFAAVRRDSDRDSSFHGSDSEPEKEESWFNLTLSKGQWISIKPDSSQSNKENLFIDSLQPGAWTSVIAEEFFKQFSLPCAFSFKRSEITKKKRYAKITGYCRSKTCNNMFHGYLENEPSPHQDEVVIRVRTRDTSREQHEDCKRYLKGNLRREYGKRAHAEGSSNLLKRLRREGMGRGDVDGPLLPHNEVIRHAKKEHVDRELGMQKDDEKDVIQRIYEMQFSREYMGSIKAVGYNPFYTFYALPEQISLYNHFREITGDCSCISIDGTGSLVRKLSRGLNLNSAHIFLHCIVIHFDKTIVSVFQILSESQETETFTFGLKKWVLSVSVKPKQCVTDYSRALLSACSKAFNNLTIKAYIEFCFSFACGKNTLIEERISTFLRVDVAHLIHFICRWDATKAITRREVRDFLIRCVALMVDCQHLDQFQEIFTLTCVVGSHEYENTVLDLPYAKTVKEARENLENYIITRRIDIDGHLEVESDGADENRENREQFDTAEDTSSIGNFITNLLARAGTVVEEGTELNAFFAPRFIQELVRIAKEFPLWTAVGIPFLIGHAKSCYSEKNFQDLKNNVLQRYSRKIGVEKFLRIHMHDLIGSTRSLESKLLQFNASGLKLPSLKRKTPNVLYTNNFSILNDFDNSIAARLDSTEVIESSLPEDSDLFSRELWKGKTGKNVFHQSCKDFDVSATPETFEARNNPSIQFESELNSLDLMMGDTRSSSKPSPGCRLDDEGDDDGSSDGAIFICTYCTKIGTAKKLKKHDCKG